MCDSVASRLGKKRFEKRLEYWFAKLGKKQFCTFMCNSVASRLGEEVFEKRLEYWFDKLGEKQFCTFMCDSVASRLGQVKFDTILDKMHSALGEDFVKIMSLGSVAKRIESSDFTDMLAVWMQKLNNQEFRRIMCNSFAKRLMEENFTVEVDFWLMKMEGYFVKMMHNSVATHLAKIGMRDKMLYWHKLLGVQNFATFAYNNAPAIYDDKAKSRFMEWYQKLPTKKFHTFMSGGIGKELLEDPMNRKILQIHDMIGETRSITLFSKPSFVKTVKESADQLMAFCSEMNCDGERIYMSLKENGFKLET